MALRRVFVVNKKYPEAGLKLLRDKFEVIVSPYTDEHANSMNEIKKQIVGVDGVIWCTKHRLNKELLDLAGPNLTAITTMSSGVDQVDLEEVRRRNLPIGNTPRALDDAVADIALGLLIAAARRFKEGVAELESGEWKYGVQWMCGVDIARSTVGIIGLGGIGQSIVRRLKGFGVARFLYSGRSDKPEAKDLDAKRVSLNELLTESDFVIVCCPLTTETRHLISTDALKMMKNNAVLVNIARGELVDQEALLTALRDKQIFAAGLDVVTPEPLPKDHPLLGQPNCYIIPHMGSATIRTRDEMAIIAANNILLALDGKPMQCHV